MHIQTNDRNTYAITQREYTDEGFLRVPARVARTGIQEYLAGELGLTGDANRIVKVMRPPEEVFSVSSLDTYRGADITIEHPSGMVNSDTYRKVSVGTTLDIGSQDGDFVKCDLIIKDKEGIKAAEGGKVQLSVGYTALYDDNVPEGAEYEFIQRDIQVNHIALVDRARAGMQARLFDKQPTRNTKMFLITLDSGKTVEVEDSSTAQLINDHVERLTKRVKDAEEATEKTKAEKDEFEEKKKEAEDELEEEKKKSSEDSINSRIESISKVKDQAAKVAGKEFKTESLDELTIKTEALASIQPKRDWADKSEAYILAAFDIASEKEAEDEEEDKEDEKDSKDAYKQLVVDMASKRAKDGTESPRQKSIDSMTGAWKTKQAGEK